MKDRERADEDDELTEEERELQRKYVDDLLRSCEANAPHIYVLELMKVLPASSRLRDKGYSFKNKEYSFSMLPIIELVERVGFEAFRSPVLIEEGLLRRAVAVAANGGELESLGISGECLWLRKVDSDELFETKNHWLLLQSRQIREIDSEFVLNALLNHLPCNGNDARLAILYAAGELLMEYLEEDLWLIPDRFSDVVAAIDEVLAGQDCFELNEEKVRCLASAVVAKVSLS